MPRALRTAALLVSALLACTPGESWTAPGESSTTAPSGAAIPGPTVILISLDGTRSDAPAAAGCETLPSLARRGARARRLTSVFPSNTFPAHVSLVTGVAPEVHGIVNNTFLDPGRGLFSKDGDPSWIEVEPLWSLAARQGVVAASFHWVGSEGLWRSGHGARHWRPFDPRTPERDKVQQILTWLDLEDPAQRPRLITSWFHGADGEGHRHGPDSEQARRALREQDRVLGELVSALERRGAFETTTLLIVSDHGMASVERSVDLDEALERADVDARVFGAGGFASVKLRRPAEAERAIEVARGQGLEAWRREDAPRELRVRHPRFGDVVVLAPLGTAVQKTGLLQPAMRGSHGYRPEEPGMGAVFVAFGRGARPGTELEEVRAIDVAPTVLRLLELPVPDWMEGAPIPELLPPAGTLTRLGVLP